jgi:hypothetical protein
MSDTALSLLPGMDAISASLGAASPIATIPRPQSKELVEVKESPEVEDDYQEARSNMKELISQAMEMVPEMVELTRQSQSDKMYSAAASFIKAAADLNISLSKLSKEIKRQPAPKGAPGQPETPLVQHNTQNNIVFNGSTEEFLDMLEARKKEKKDAAAAALIVDADFIEVEPST